MPPPPATPLTAARLGATIACLLIVIVSWGTNYPVTKLALRDIAPLTFSALRLLGGAAVVACILASTGAKLLPPREERLPLAWISLLQFASVVGFASVALLFLPAGRTVTAIYSMPLWAAVFSVVILGSRLRLVQYLGIVVSLAGMILFMDPAVIDWSKPGAALGMGLTLTAAMMWGLGAVLYRKRSWSSSLLCQTLWQLLASGVVLAIAAAVMEYPSHPALTLRLGIIFLWNWVVPTAVAVWAWSNILRYISAPIAGQFLMTTPFVGIAFSAWVFKEDLPPVFTLSAILITLGGVLTLLPPWRGAPKPSPAAKY